MAGGTTDRGLESVLSEGLVGKIRGINTGKGLGGEGEACGEPLRQGEGSAREKPGKRMTSIFNVFVTCCSPFGCQMHWHSSQFKKKKVHRLSQVKNWEADLPP